MQHSLKTHYFNVVRNAPSFALLNHCESFISILDYSSKTVHATWAIRDLWQSVYKTHQSGTGCIPPYHGRVSSAVFRLIKSSKWREICALPVSSHRDHSSFIHSFRVLRVKMAFSTPHCLSIRHSQQMVHGRGRVLGIGRVGIKWMAQQNCAIPPYRPPSLPTILLATY